MFLTLRASGSNQFPAVKCCRNLPLPLIFPLSLKLYLTFICDVIPSLSWSPPYWFLFLFFLSLIHCTMPWIITPDQCPYCECLFSLPLLYVPPHNTALELACWTEPASCEPHTTGSVSVSSAIEFY